MTFVVIVVVTFVLIVVFVTFVVIVTFVLIVIVTFVLIVVLAFVVRVGGGGRLSVYRTHHGEVLQGLVDPELAMSATPHIYKRSV